MAKRKTKKKVKVVKKSKQKITKNMNFLEVLNKYPQSAGIMMNYGLHCVGCQAASFETIEQGAKAHGMPSKDLNKMIDEMNKLANEKKIEYKHEPVPKKQALVKPKKKSFLKKLFS